jgi:hypothetical protein
MKSPLIQNADYIPEEEKKGYSDLKVMKSAAGYYIGTTFTDDTGFTEPGSRDSEYFDTRELADAALASNSWDQREHP